MFQSRKDRLGHQQVAWVHLAVVPEQTVAVAQLLDDVAGVAVHPLEWNALLLAVGHPAGVEAGVAVVDGEFHCHSK